MNQEQRLDYLVETLKEDSVRYQEIDVQKSERRAVMRSLMNIRFPKPMAPDWLTIQDQFLKDEAALKGIVNLSEIPTIKEVDNSTHPYADKISIWQGDITRLAVDGIVNAANSQMLGCFVPCHKCIDNAIHSASGIQLREACNSYMKRQREKFGDNYEEETGKAMVTPGFNLPAKHVIHTVGPIVMGRLTNELITDLKNCYESCLQAAIDHGIRSIAFCCISTGEFHFPNEEAAKIAVDAVDCFLKQYHECFDRVVFNVFKEEDFKHYHQLLT